MGQPLYLDSYPEEEFRQLLASWAALSKFQESGSAYIYHKGIVLRRHEALCKRRDLLDLYFKGVVPTLIDIDYGHLEDQENLECEFKKVETTVPHPIYWICGIDRLLIGKSDAFFHYLRARQARNPAISYVLFFNINFLHSSVSSILTYTSTFLQNTLITPLHSEATSRYFLQYWMHEWHVAIPKSVQDEIINATKHHFHPIKQAVRYIRDTKSIDIQNILHHDMMRLKVKSMLDGLLPSEQSALEKIVLGANDFSADETESINFLKQTSWLETHTNHLRVSIPILEEYIESLQKPAHKISIEDTRLVIGNIPIDSMFSSQERSVLCLFIQKTGQIVLRDDIASAMWGNSWAENYSDWAIDQLIYRLRKKCIELNLSKKTIQSVKGKGFLYE